MALNGPFLRAENISLRYPGNIGAKALGSNIWKKLIGVSTTSKPNESKLVLDNISLDLKSGDRLGLAGHNGAGKSTLLKVLSGGIPPQQGTIESHGKTICLLRRTQGMSLEATGYENIFLRGLYLGYSIDEVKKKLDDIIEFSELDDKIYAPLRSYSAGMRARLSISILMACDAQIVLLDEWLGAGDPSFQKKAAAALNKYLEEASIVVFASHNERIRNRICNKTLVLENGKILSLSP